MINDKRQTINDKRQAMDSGGHRMAQLMRIMQNIPIIYIISII